MSKTIIHQLIIDINIEYKNYTYTYTHTRTHSINKNIVCKEIEEIELNKNILMKQVHTDMHMRFLLNETINKLLSNSKQQLTKNFHKMEIYGKKKNNVLLLFLHIIF